MKNIIILFSLLSPFYLNTVFSQSVYYSMNGSTNTNLLNSWTRDPGGSTLLLPPYDFNNPLDSFIIDGEDMNISGEWIVAGTVKVLNGTLNDPNLYKFQAKTFLLYSSNISYLFIGNPGDIHFGTMIIAPNSQLNTGNSYSGNCIQIDDSAVVRGKLLITNPMFGPGKFSLEAGGTLNTINNGIYKTSNIGQILVSGPRYYSKEANYEFGSNVGSFNTGDGLPDTVASLVINNGDNTTTTLTSSTTVTGDFSSAGFSGGSNNNSEILLDSNKLICLGNVFMSGGVALNGTSHSAFIIKGVSGLPTTVLTTVTVDSLVFDRNAYIYLIGNSTAVSYLVLKKGIIVTGNGILQLGVSAEGTLQQYQGWVAGTYASFKNNTSTNPILFPLGSGTYHAFITFKYTTPPTQSGFIKVSFFEGTGSHPLSPSIIDGSYSIDYYSGFYWKVEPVVVTGGVLDVTADLKNISGHILSQSSTLLISDNTGTQFHLEGDRASDSDTLASRINIPGDNAFGRYYIGGDSLVTSVNNSNTNTNKTILEQNYPNPFGNCTKIKYSLPEKTFVTLKVYNFLGIEIASLVEKEQPMGSYEVNFKGFDYPDGIYFYKLTTRKCMITKWMDLIK